MNKQTQSVPPSDVKLSPTGANFFDSVWEESWIYIKTVIDIVREPILILDGELRVLAANDPFYRTFQVDQAMTEGRLVYNLGNGQWDIPAFRKLIEDILPKNTFFKGFEVDHVFPHIGKKVMILNARQMHFKEGSTTQKLPPIILLAIEDVTEIMLIAESLAAHTRQMEVRLREQTTSTSAKIRKLESEVNRQKVYRRGKKNE